MGGAQRVLEGVLEKTRGLVTGVTCGAGMPYKLSEIAGRYNVHYLPIISSARAFRALWTRAYHKVADLMAAVSSTTPGSPAGPTAWPNPTTPRFPQTPYPPATPLPPPRTAAGAPATSPPRRAVRGQVP